MEDNINVTDVQWIGIASILKINCSSHSEWFEMKEIYIKILLTISRHYPKKWLRELANISASECYLFPVLYVGYIEMQPQKILCKVRKKTKKEKWKWKKAPCISVSSNEGLVFLCLTPCDWYAKLATTPPQKQCKTETDCN